MSDFTPTQGRYLAFILEYTNRYGLPPAEVDISQALEVSAPSANQMVRTLESKGLIARKAGVPRSIEIKLGLDQIPKWRGRVPPRTEMVWAKDNASANRAADAIIQARVEKRAQMLREKAGNGSSKIYRFKITLKESSPPIWRRIETSDLTLGAFHQLLQRVMGWTNSHLHLFEIDRQTYTDPKFAESDSGNQSYQGMRLSTILGDHESKFRFRYIYDFGDNWEHEILLEKTFDAVPGVRYPICTAGKLACPPEDVGGMWGYYDFIEAISDRKHAEHKDRLEWSGPYDPNQFDPDAISELLLGTQ